MYQLFVGEIGYNRDEFLLKLKWWEIKAILNGYRRRERTYAETVRWQTWVIISSLGAKINNPKDLRELPWDEEENEITQSMTEEERNELLQEMDEINKHLAEQNAQDNGNHSTL